ncbi:hypothetical protein GC163_11220 [bacterium]|nr:hypothetical protein [bacterium]
MSSVSTGVHMFATTAAGLASMVQLGQLNGRLKDFFDLWLLSRRFEFDARLLSEVITRTFQNRKAGTFPPFHKQNCPG